LIVRLFGRVGLTKIAGLPLLLSFRLLPWFTKITFFLRLAWFAEFTITGLARVIWLLSFARFAILRRLALLTWAPYIARIALIPRIPLVAGVALVITLIVPLISWIPLIALLITGFTLIPLIALLPEILTPTARRGALKLPQGAAQGFNFTLISELLAVGHFHQFQNFIHLLQGHAQGIHHFGDFLNRLAHG
jgi:hypothetical protein